MILRKEPNLGIIDRGELGLQGELDCAASAQPVSWKDVTVDCRGPVAHRTDALDHRDLASGVLLPAAARF
jgi:hypothetical protein